MRTILAIIAGISLVGVQSCVAQQPRTVGPFEETRIPVGSAAASVLTLDVNRDGNLDLLVANAGGVTLLMGNGSGQFEPRSTMPAGENPVDLAGGDLNEDGHPDLVVANHETDYVSILSGGAEGFDSGRDPSRLNVGVSPHPHAVSLADLDDDGHLDILVDDRAAEALRVLWGRGDGSFDRGDSIDVRGDPYRGMAVGDLNRDGHLDVATPNPGTVAITFGGGAGGFTAGPDLRAGGLRPFAVAIADMNGDAIPDIAAGSGEGAGAVVVWFGNGDGSFRPDPESPYSIAEGPTSLAVSDVDGDGIEDLLVASYVGDGLAILFGGRQSLRMIRMEIDGSPWGMATGDFNGDGRMDVVTSNDGSGDISVLLAREDLAQ